MRKEVANPRRACFPGCAGCWKMAGAYYRRTEPARREADLAEKISGRLRIF